METLCTVNSFIDLTDKREKEGGYKNTYINVQTSIFNHNNLYIYIYIIKFSHVAPSVLRSRKGIGK